MDPNQLLELIKSRRSVRRYADRPVDEQTLEQVLEAGRWAPSGQNNQPWRFAVVRSAQARERMARLTKYGKIIAGAPVCVAVLLHNPSMYHQIKDAQGIGACLQNMLLQAHGLGLGAVWLGEILNRAAEVLDVLGLGGGEYELMAVVAMGWPEGGQKGPSRLPLDELVVARLD